MSTPRARLSLVLAVGCATLLCAAEGRVRADVIHVGADAASPQAALAMAKAGDVISVPRGHWSGPLLVDKSVIVRGEPGAMIDGHGQGTVVTVTATGATLEGLEIRGSGEDVGKPDCCVYVSKAATAAVVRNNHLRDCAFGIWIHETDGARIEGNRIEGRKLQRTTDRGNGIQLFNASHLVVARNHVSDARDGIYVSATEDSLIEGNTTDHDRYGVHYMFSYRNTLRGNHSSHNIIGLALMESHHLVVTDNVVTDNERNGLLFRDVEYCKILRNRLEHNGYALFFFSSTENVIADNRVAYNDVGFKIWAGTVRNRISGNVIIGNREQVFYVGSEDQIWGDEGRGNFWGDYLGWDQNHDGVGERPYRVDSLKANLLFRYPIAALLLRSPALELLSHLAEKMPMLRVPTVVDVAPLVRGGS